MRRLPRWVQDDLRRFSEGWKPLSEQLLDAVLPLPSPKELGRSDSNALPLREWGFNEDESLYSWEDWEAEMRRDYPAAWLLRRTLPAPFKKALHRVETTLEDAIYWVKCHTLKSYRFHVLDLRNPGGGEAWSYGWRDRSIVMLYACFKILVDYVELERPNDMEQFCRDNPAEAESWSTRLHAYREMMALYRWWKFERAQEWSKVERILQEADEKDRKEHREIFRRYNEKRGDFDANDQKQLMRLVAIREYLWS